MDGKTLFTIVVSAYAYYFMRKVLKRTKTDSQLTKNEKVQVIILLLINTLFSGIILYFGWKQKLPLKAKQVVTYLKRIIGILVGIAVLGILVSVLLVAINPKNQIEKAQKAAITPTIAVTQ